MSDECVTEHLSHSESASLKDVSEEQNFCDEEILNSSLLVDGHRQQIIQHHNSESQVANSPLTTTKSNTITSSPSASSDSGHCSRASPDITSLTATPNGALQSMASASGESPTDYHHSWGMCATDAVKVDLTSQTSHVLQESDSNIYSTSGDHLNSSYPELSPTHQTYSNSLYESMQGLYQNHYSASSNATAAAALAAANYYQQSSPYGGIISQSYNGSRSISQCKSSSSAALAAPYLNSSPFSTSFTNSNSQTAQNAYNCYGQYPTSFSNSSSNSQSFGNCQQSGIDYSTYSGFSHATGYSPYYTSGYSGYIPNSSSSNVNNSSPPSGLSSTNNSSSATYHLTQLPQQTGVNRLNADTDGQNIKLYLQTDPSLSNYHHINDCPSPVKTEPLLNSSVGVKKGTGKSGRRGRRQTNPSPGPENDLDRVFIWDLDETIILFLSILNGTRAGRVIGEDATHFGGYDLAEQLDGLINRFAENHFFYNDLEEVDQIHIDATATDDNGQDLSNYNFQTDGFHTTASCGVTGLGLTSPVRGGVDWLRKMAFRYRKIKEVYTQYRDNVGGLLSNQDRENLYKIQRKWDVITDNWTLLALKCLQLINSRPKAVNVLVTSISLVPSLAKVMIFGLAPNFNIENIYSAAKPGKKTIFEQIQTSFGKKCTYVVIGDGKEEESAARELNLPFWPVQGISDLVALHHALDLGHL